MCESCLRCCSHSCALCCPETLLIALNPVEADISQLRRCVLPSGGVMDYMNY